MPELTLASFNTHYGLCPWRHAYGPYDLGAALDALGDPDVIVLQEVWRPDGRRGVVDDFAAARGYTHTSLALAPATIVHRWPHVDPNGVGTFGVAVLARVPLELVDHPVVGPTVGDAVPERRVLRGVLRLAGTPVDLVAVHLTSRLPHGPPLQLRRLARLLPAGDRPGIIAGDCNFWGPPTQALLPGWRRTVRGRTWPAHRPHSQIDHVLVRGAVTVLDAAVLPPTGSDHRPVRVRLRIGETDHP